MSKFALILSFFIAVLAPMQLSHKALFKQAMKAFLSDHKNNKVLKFPFKILVNFKLL